MIPLERMESRGAQLLPAAARGTPSARSTPKSTFSDVLRGEVARGENVRFSAHAQQRLDSRAIRLTPDDQDRISRAVDQAAAKGARESLLLMDGVALVVSVPNRTVITALGTNESDNTVITNIDSAVVVPGSLATPTQQENPGLDPMWGSPRAADRLMRRAEMEA